MGEPRREKKNDESNDSTWFRLVFSGSWLDFRLSARGRAAWVLLIAVLSGGVIFGLIRAIVLYLSNGRVVDP